MSQPLPEKRRLRIGTFTEVVASRQAYLRILYLLLAFPLGLFYFVFLTVALSAGVATLVIGVGIVILFGALFISRALVVFERRLAASMLGADIPAPQLQRVPVQGFWLRVKRMLGDSSTWKGLVYLLAKFPFGMLSFIVSVTSIAMVGALVLTPVLYSRVPIQIGFHQVNSLDEALFWSIVGLVLGLVFFYVLTALAVLWGRFAEIMLAGPSAREPSEESTVAPARAVVIP